MNLQNSFVFRTSHPCTFLFYLENGEVSHIVYFNSKLFFYDFKKENIKYLAENALNKIAEYAKLELGIEAKLDMCVFMGGSNVESNKEQFCFQNKRNPSYRFV